MAWLPTWLRRAQPDGESAVLEAVAFGGSALVANGLAVPQDEQPATATGRRDRALDAGDRVLMDSLAEKVLHGWLQNRHQTLYPLTVNLRQLDPAKRVTLARWLAVSMLANRSATGAQQAAAQAWFTSVGADAALLATLDAALTDPPALSHTLASIAEGGLSAYAYVLALVALDPSDPASLPFLDYVAAGWRCPPPWCAVPPGGIGNRAVVSGCRLNPARSIPATQPVAPNAPPAAAAINPPA